MWDRVPLSPPYANIAQLEVQRTCNAQVAGSSPVVGSIGIEMRREWAQVTQGWIERKR